MGTSYDRLRERLDRAEVETGELRKAIANAVEEGSIHPSAAGAELIARAIRGGDNSYTKALAKHGHELASDAITDRLRKARAKREAEDDSGHNLFNRI